MTRGLEEAAAQRIAERDATGCACGGTGEVPVFQDYFGNWETATCRRHGMAVAS